MAEQIRNTGGPADGATVTPNTIMVQVGVMHAQAPGAIGGVVIATGFPQMKVETLLDPDAAELLARNLLAAAVEARTPQSGILRPGLNLPNGFGRH